MKTLLFTLFNWIVSRLRERWHLSLENLALRHQLEVLKRSAKRPQFSPTDRGLWVILSSVWSGWPQAVEIMQADTVRRWRRHGMWHYLKWRRGRKRSGRPPIASDTRQLIRQMSRDNRLWGSPRIRGELLKLGITVSQTTVAKYMDRRPGPPSPTWRAFWRMHAPDLHVDELYAELSGHFRALSTRVFRIMTPFCNWLWERVSDWWLWRLHRHVKPVPPSAALESEPAAEALKVIELVRAFGRSPPGCQPSSIDSPAHPGSPIEVGRVEVRLVAPVRDGEGAPRQVVLNPQGLDHVPRPDGSQQFAA